MAGNVWLAPQTRTEHNNTLPFVNAWQQLGTRWPVCPIGQGEFTKLVYDSKFTKLAEGMSFVNSLLG